MSDSEEGWLDSAVDWVTDTAESVGETVSEGYEKLEGSLTHSLRGIEDTMDTDDDGSILDEVGGNWIKDIPVVGGVLGGVGEELGDFATDVMGTRHSGVFSEDGTYDPTTKDSDYQPGSTFQEQGGGFGQWINEEAGIGENDPSDLLYGAAVLNPAAGATYAALGGLGDLVDGNDDPYVEGDQTSTYHDYDGGAAPAE